MPFFFLEQNSLCGHCRWLLFTQCGDTPLIKAFIRLALKVSLLMTLGAASAWAQPGENSHCATARSQLELNRCWAHEADIVRQRLAATLKATLDETPVRAQTEQAQAKWVEYRDAHCAAVAAIYEGGSMQPMQRDACLVRLSEQRILELKAVLPESK